MRAAAAAAGSSACLMQPDVEQVCGVMADQCADLFCPTCGLAGQCDTTCGFCIASTVTTTTTTTGTTCANRKEDSFCECDACKDICATIYCPTCPNAGWCDLSCGYCTASTSVGSNTSSSSSLQASTADATTTVTATAATSSAAPASSSISSSSTGTTTTTTLARPTSSTAGDFVAGTGGDATSADTTTVTATTTSSPRAEKPEAAATVERTEEAGESSGENAPSPSDAGLQIWVACLASAGILGLGLLLCVLRRRQRLRGQLAQDDKGDPRSPSSAKASPDDVALSFVEEAALGTLMHVVAFDEGGIKLACPAVQVAGSRGASTQLAMASSPVEARDLEVAETPEKRGMLVGEPVPQELGKKLAFSWCTREDYLDDGGGYLEEEEDNKRDY